jgi:hypothetical protein
VDDIDLDGFTESLEAAEVAGLITESLEAAEVADLTESLEATEADGFTASNLEATELEGFTDDCTLEITDDDATDAEGFTESLEASDCESERLFRVNERFDAADTEDLTECCFEDEDTTEDVHNFGCDRLDLASDAPDMEALSDTDDPPSRLAPCSSSGAMLLILVTCFELAVDLDGRMLLVLTLLDDVDAAMPSEIISWASAEAVGASGAIVFDRR